MMGTDEFSVIVYIACIEVRLLRVWMTCHVIKYRGRVCVERDCGIGI